ncbi:MAG: zf-HC2 domain-containing protein [Pirellulaceae bacterium]|nr:zf-HC2 domain-containing protein [Pirellulaceae bacterium]
MMRECQYLDDFLDGDLNRVECDQFERHLEFCKHCETEVAHHVETYDALRAGVAAESAPSAVVERVERVIQWGRFRRTVAIATTALSLTLVSAAVWYAVQSAENNAAQSVENNADVADPKDPSDDRAAELRDQQQIVNAQPDSESVVEDQTPTDDASGAPDGEQLADTKPQRPKAEVIARSGKPLLVHEVPSESPNVSIFFLYQPQSVAKLSVGDN